ncbi:MAG: lactate racemase domain-containing protein [Candidatus Jordarchaeaceae archaeon]
MRTGRALDKIVTVSIKLLSELLGVVETVDKPDATHKFRSCVEKVIHKHPQILNGFDFKWLELNAFNILGNLLKIEETSRRKKCTSTLFDLLQTAFSCCEELGVDSELLDKPSLIYNVYHPLFEEYELAKGIIHDKLVWFKKEKTKVEENKNKITISLRCRNRLESTKISKSILNGVLEPPKTTHEKLSINSIIQFLNAPIGAAPLSEEVSGVKNVAIILDYASLPLTEDVLKLVLKELKKVGITKIEIVLACGLNRPNSKIARELLNITANKYSVSFHNALDEDSLTEVGKTLSGAKLKINTKIVDADYRIAIGLIRPDPYAGFTGGYQSILPGVAGAEAIVCNQVRGILLSSKIGAFADNPVFKDIQSVASLCNIDFLLNAVVDNKGTIVDFVAGNPEKAYTKGITVSRKLFTTEVNERVEVVISAPGKPYDQDLYTSLQSLGATKHLLKPNGLSVLVVDLNNGGLNELEKVMAIKYNEFLEMVYKDPKTLLIRNILEVEGRNLILVSGKSLKDIGRLPIINVEKLSEAIDQAKRIIKPSSILVVREAWNVIPEFKNGEPPFSSDF